MKKIIYLIGLLPALLFAEVRTVNVGVAANFTPLNDTMWNVYANHFKNGVSLAISDASKILSEHNIKIELREFNYGDKKIDALNFAYKIAKSDVVATIGYPYSSDVLLAGTVFNENKLLLLSPSATADRVGELGRYVRTCVFKDTQQGKLLSKVAREFKLAKVAVISVSDCAYCQSLRSAFRKDFENHKGRIVFDETILEDQIEDSSIINSIASKLKKKEVDAIFLPNYERVSATLIASLFDKGIKPKIWLGGDGWGGIGELFSKIIGKRSVSGLTLAHWHPEEQSEKSKSFQKNYLKEFDKEPNDIAAVSYEAMSILIAAITKAKSLDREGILTSLEQADDFSGLLGTISYSDGSRTPEKTVVVLKLDAGKVSFLEKVK